MSATARAGTAPRIGRRRPSTRHVRNRILIYLAFLFYLVIACFPVAYMFITTLKADYDIIDPTVNPFWFKRPLSLVHYQYLFTQTNFPTWALNTVIVAACVVGITLAITLPGGYALARLNFRGAQ
ncbi:MAG: hypothetical protein WAM30_18995, partial [Candidatus Dormiibacterota bacterium]